MTHKHHHDEVAITEHKTWKQWIPLGVVFSYIVGLTILASITGPSSTYTVSSYLMGYFFVIFSLFKLLDLQAFALGYQEYDIIAQKNKYWGYIYPFIELLLGILYLLTVDAAALHIATIILATVTCISVLIKLAKHETFQCVCLGTVFKIPLTIVSLIEYAFMGLMAVLMLLNVLR